MGTRNLTCVVQNGQFKVAQYGQWDGYPEGQGATCLEFLRDEMDEQKFNTNLNLSRDIGSDGVKKILKDLGADDSGWLTYDVSNKFDSMYPTLHRNTGAGILKLIQDSENGVDLKTSLSFASEGSWCEWAYVIDLDTRTFEAYSYSDYYLSDQTEGENRFEKALGGKSCLHRVKTFSFDSLPTNDEFFKVFEDARKKSEDEEVEQVDHTA